MAKKRRAPYYLLLILLLCVMGYSGYQLISYYAEQVKRDHEFADLVSLVQLPSATETPSSGAPEPDRTAEQLAAYRALHEQNSEFVGWITIDGTAVNYPVMQSPSRPNFYLRHNFEGDYSVYGVPYLNEDCDLKDCDNMTVYGHNMKNDRMFGHLERYRKKEFFTNQRFIRFDTLDGLGLYEIFAVFDTTADQNDPDYFPYHIFIKAENEAEYRQFVNRCRALSYYDTGVVPEYGERLLTLSTCEDDAATRRLVVVARKCN